jgi:hypothetical protein
MGQDSFKRKSRKYLSKDLYDCRIQKNKTQFYEFSDIGSKLILIFFSEIFQCKQ